MSRKFQLLNLPVIFYDQIQTAIREKGKISFQFRYQLYTNPTKVKDDFRFQFRIIHRFAEFFQFREVERRESKARGRASLVQSRTLIRLISTTIHCTTSFHHIQGVRAFAVSKSRFQKAKQIQKLKGEMT